MLPDLGSDHRAVRARLRGPVSGPVVFLCTGNAARSVMAGAALAAHLPDWHVTTAGTLVVEGQPMSWRTKAALEAVGPRRSLTIAADRQPDAELGHAALVIALAPEHVHWVRRTHAEAAVAHGHPPPSGSPPARPTTAPSPSGWPPCAWPTRSWRTGRRSSTPEAATPTRSLPVQSRWSTWWQPSPRGWRADDGQHLTADEAAALLHPVDSLGMPLGPGQPPAFLEALGRRTDWEHLRIGGALLTVLTDLFSHPNVHYLSGFYGPLERLLRDSGANIGFAPADFRRFTPILEADPPRVMATAAAPPDADGQVSLSLHAGASVDQLRRAAADPDRLLVVEVSDHVPPHLRLRATPSRHRRGATSTC